MQTSARIYPFPNRHASKTASQTNPPQTGYARSTIQTVRGDFWEYSKNYPLKYIAQLVRGQIKNLIDEERIPTGEYAVVEHSTASQETLNIVIRSTDAESLFDPDRECTNIDELFRMPQNYFNAFGRRMYNYLDLVLNLYNRRVIDRCGTVLISRYYANVHFRHDFILQQLCRETMPPAQS